MSKRLKNVKNNYGKLSFSLYLSANKIITINKSKI